MELVSATQVTSYLDCKRKLIWRYIAQIVTEPHPSMKLGTEVHDEQLGPYLLEGRTFDYTRDSGYIAASAMPYLPEPKTPGLELERHFMMPSPSWRTHEFGYQGYLDMWHLDSSVMPGLPGGVPLVSDFKTTSNLRYAKNETTLATDVQAMLYATWAMRETGRREVDLAWIYMQTKGKARKAKRTHLRVVGDHVNEQFKRIDAVAVEMFELRKRLVGVDPMRAAFEVEPNIEMCDQYGGCPYRGNCNLAPSVFVDAEVASDLEQMEAATMSNTVGFLARIKKQSDAAKVQLINPPEAAAVVTPPLPAKDPVGADVAAYTAPAEEKAPRKRATKADVAASIVNISNNATLDDRLTLAFKAAAKAFLEALS